MALPTSARSGNIVLATLLLALVLAVGFSLRDLRREWIVRQTELALERQTLALQRGDVAMAAGAPGLKRGFPARALVHQALYLARFSETVETKPVRDQLLSDARSGIDAALARRPHWGEAWTVRAYLGSICRCETAETTARALERSYADAPFLRGAAPWRVKLGLTLWPLLSLGGRDFVVEEGVWSTRSDDDAREPLFAAFRGSPAYERFFLRWRQFRHDDADMRGVRAPTP